MRLDSAVRMNIKDGILQLHNKTQEIIGEQFKSDGWEITVHENPAEDHEVMVLHTLIIDPLYMNMHLGQVG